MHVQRADVASIIGVRRRFEPFYHPTLTYGEIAIKNAMQIKRMKNKPFLNIIFICNKSALDR